MSERDDRLQIHATERLLDGWIAVDRLTLRHRRFDGDWTPSLQRIVVQRGEAVVVLPYDPARDSVVLIEQFRAGPAASGGEPWLIEAVAGLLDQGGTPEATARRELVEEAGLHAGPLALVYEGYASPGYSDEYLFGFVACIDSDAVAGHHGLEDEDEDIRPFVLSFDEALARWRRGGIRNVPTVAVLLALAAERDRLRSLWR
ncbi:MAG: NUDIX domain-containing protein [Pseudomonadota bacterium]